MSSMVKEDKFGKVLGERETEIMEVVWRTEDSISVKEVTELLKGKRKIAYTTVMTIMGRLVQKGILKRKSVKNHYGYRYEYKPSYSKDKFLTKVSQQIIRSLVASFGDAAIANFTKEIEKIPLEKRQKLIAKLKKANE